MYKSKFYIIITILASLFSCTKSGFYQVEYSLSSIPFSDTLKAKKINVHSGREIRLSGYINGAAKLQIDNGASIPIIIELSNEIDETIKGDWYSSNTVFWYIPDSVSNPQGHITVKYRTY